jgi:hypothetical protein
MTTRERERARQEVLVADHRALRVATGHAPGKDKLLVERQRLTALCERQRDRFRSAGRLQAVGASSRDQHTGDAVRFRRPQAVDVAARSREATRRFGVAADTACGNGRALNSGGRCGRRRIERACQRGWAERRARGYSGRPCSRCDEVFARCAQCDLRSGAVSAPRSPAEAARASVVAAPVGVKARASGVAAKALD